MPQIGCILLASGFGRRFGANKLMLPVEGVPLYRRALERLRPLPLARVAVTSQYPDILAQAAAMGFLPLPNPEAGEGIAAGIRLGLAALAGLDGALFSVCDQPWLTSESIKRLLDSFSSYPQGIHALSWRGARGNPVVFPAACFPELSALQGDVGGGAVIKRHPALLTLVETGCARELADVDTPADLDEA